MPSKPNLHGLLLVDKPTDCTSHDVVARARRLLNIKSIGHSGTLDPLASGLMVLLVGEGTKLSDFILNENKRYHVRMQFGLISDTLDRTGQILERREVDLEEARIRSALETTLGDFEWPVPHFSAVKIQGRKLYDYARAGQDVERPLRIMRFFDLHIHEIGKDSATVELSCSKGSYIRTWVDQVGRVLGCGAVLDQLRRLRSEPFSIDEAVRLEQLQAQQKENPEQFHQWIKDQAKGFLSMSHSLPQLKNILVLPTEEALLRNGQVARSLSARLLADMRGALAAQSSMVVKAVNHRGELMALLELGPRGLQVRRVFVGS